jgi:succinyl-CoA synthetase beta subunit
VDIEEVAAQHPEKIITLPVDPASGLQPFHARKLAYGFKLPKELHKPFAEFLSAFYECFTHTDASQVEINPLVITDQGKLLALDAKFNFDENALYRHPGIAQLRDPHEEDPLEQEASKYGLSYVKMDGNIGCMVNGAGLAMATMDIIKLYGSSPANFLDVGGGANKEKVTAAFKLILSDPNVEGILVNIFGGIMRCDIIAEGIIAAAREVSLNIPLVVRLEGTNVELGKKMLASSGLAIVAADNLADAADKITGAVKRKAA